MTQHPKAQAVTAPSLNQHPRRTWPARATFVPPQPRARPPLATNPHAALPARRLCAPLAASRRSPSLAPPLASRVPAKSAKFPTSFPRALCVRRCQAPAYVSNVCPTGPPTGAACVLGGTRAAVARARSTPTQDSRGRCACPVPFSGARRPCQSLSVTLITGCVATMLPALRLASTASSGALRLAAGALQQQARHASWSASSR